MFSALVAVIGWSVFHDAASSSSVSRCNPASHICQGRCPPLPRNAPLPRDEKPEGLCLLDSETEACVCWLWNPSTDRHLQTLFKCELASNSSARHALCLPPPFCFPPGSEPGCLIVPFCPCARFGRGARYGTWHSVVASIHRSNLPVDEKEITTQNGEPVREFNLKHLLFLLAFVIAPLCCWCLLTFFHEGKCRRNLHVPATRHVSPRRGMEDQPAALQQHPTAPKCESPPPYREATDPVESCLLPCDGGAPPSYEDAVQCQWQLMLVPRIPESDTH